eukprot:m.156284 g.156284  ORF g.156284 m.156284 type:complete len:72 (+) comp13336_c1_seq4:954-1169(+)
MYINITFGECAGSSIPSLWIPFFLFLPSTLLYSLECLGVKLGVFKVRCWGLGMDGTFCPRSWHVFVTIYIV